MNFNEKFNEGLPYDAFLDKHADDGQKARWEQVYDQVRLTDPQRLLLQSFTRQMKVLVTAGTWCGDCVNQCPIFARFVEANDNIDVRYFDRDEHSDLSQELSICGAPRVPSVLFLSEDGYVCGRAGDRTLAKYRHMAETQLGAACSTGIVVPGDELLATVTQEWLDQFERIQLMLRTSGRLRELHGD